MDFVGWILYRLDQYVYSPLFVSISLTRKIQVHTNESLTSWTDLYIYPSLMFTKISLLVFPRYEKGRRRMIGSKISLKKEVRDWEQRINDPEKQIINMFLNC